MLGWTSLHPEAEAGSMVSVGSSAMQSPSSTEGMVGFPLCLHDSSASHCSTFTCILTSHLSDDITPDVGSQCHTNKTEGAGSQCHAKKTER